MMPTNGTLYIQCEGLKRKNVGDVVVLEIKARILTLSDEGDHTLEVTGYEVEESDSAYDAANSAAEELGYVRSATEPWIG